MVGSALQTHVDSCMRYLTEELGLRELLQLTHDGVTSPQAAAERVLPLLAEHAGPNLVLMQACCGSPARTTEVLHRTLETLTTIDHWIPVSIRSAVEALAAPSQAWLSEVEDVLRLVVLRQSAPLPLVPTMAVLGKERCCRRLQSALSRFRTAQLIG